MVVQIHVRRLETQRGTMQFVTLDGIRIGMRSRFSKYEQRWSLWLVATDGTTIAGSLKLVGGIDLLAGLKHDTRVPPGDLFVSVEDRAPMTLDNVDVEAKLLYREAA